MPAVTFSDKRIIAVSRDVRFSPNSVENDMAILQAVASRLSASATVVDENGLKPRRKSDKCDSEDNIDRQNDRCVGVGIEGLFFIDEERDNLRNDVACRKGNKKTETCCCHAGFCGGFGGVE